MAPRLGAECSEAHRIRGVRPNEYSPFLHDFFEQNGHLQHTALE